MKKLKVIELISSIRNAVFSSQSNDEFEAESFGRTLQEAIDSTFMTEITYNELKTLRDNEELIPGMRYRIVDYQCTTTQIDTTSAGHQFDIIVTADDVNVLNENARAIMHAGDIYFADAHLESWELKYSLDNDTSRFAWADTENGKGVIYYMKDEYNNKCPYDLKNIQFKLYAGTGNDWTSYLSKTGASATTIVPYRLTRAFNGIKIGKYTWNINTNDYINAYTYSGYNDDKTTTDKTLHGEVHDCRIGNNWATVQKDDTETYEVLSLNFIVAIPFLLSEKDDTFNVYGNDFGINCHDVVISNNCYSNYLGDSCYNIHTPHNCYSWRCGNYCRSWTCGNNCYSWTCGDNCRFWTCGNGCYSWTCGNDCYSWTCGNGCSSWSCGNDCRFWSCGNDCYDWTCGNDCSSWTCGNGCHNWTCGNNCSSWSCGNNCHAWSCGNYCYSWSCKNYCYNWTCGNNCSSWKIGTSDTLGNYVSNFHLGNGISYLYISSTSKPKLTSPLTNFIIKRGIKGVNDKSWLDIIIDNEKFPLNANYELTIARNSKGEIVQYCEADFIQ